MMRAALLVILVCTNACTTEPAWCPAGESCSPAAPEGLYFAAPTVHHWQQYLLPRLAAGGAMDLELQVKTTTPDGHTYTPLDVPYTATATGALLTVTTRSNVLSITSNGDQDATATIDIRDREGLLLGRDLLDVAPVVTSDVWGAYGGGSDYEPPTTPDSVYAPGATLDVVLEGSRGELIDQAMQITGTRQLDWDLFEAPATSGTVRLMTGVHAAIDLPVPIATTVTLTRTDTSTSVSLDAPVTLCFDARSDGHEVVGATWSYTVTGVGGTNVHGTPLAAVTSCVGVSVDQGGTATAATIVVTAAGASLTVTLPVI